MPAWKTDSIHVLAQCWGGTSTKIAGGCGAQGTTWITALSVRSPNHGSSVPSWTMRHRKSYQPGSGGAFGRNLKVTCTPGCTGENGRGTRLKPQVVLFGGFCDPSL